MKLELYNCACVFIYLFFLGISIQYGCPINEYRLIIQKLTGNRSQSNGKEIIGSGMSLYKVPFFKVWVVRAFAVVVSTGRNN